MASTKASECSWGRKMSKLWYGDNLTIMQGMKKHSVDLIYLDPPFKSDANYNLLYKTMTGKPVPEQVEAFCDTWEMDAQKEAIARTMPVLMREHGVEDYYVDFWRLWMKALRQTQPHLLAYLIFMVQRLLQMKSILRPTGSIYLHCDPTASHYIKVMMDGIFGHQNFQNEIIWKRTSSHNRAKRWGPVHDNILFYSAGPKFTWNRILQSLDEDYVEQFYKQEDKRGRYRISDLTGPGMRTGDSGEVWKNADPGLRGRHWEPAPDRAIPEWFVFPDGYAKLSVRARLDILDEQGLIYWPKKKNGMPGFKRYFGKHSGVALQDIITDIGPISSQSKDRMGYPTQKPVELLDRIIQASTNKGDVVFDPFCGCGTTIYSAVKNEREWIGCDKQSCRSSLLGSILRNATGLWRAMTIPWTGYLRRWTALKNSSVKTHQRFKIGLSSELAAFRCNAKAPTGGSMGAYILKLAEG